MCDDIGNYRDLVAENLALDDEIKELKAASLIAKSVIKQKDKTISELKSDIRIMTNIHCRKVEDLRAKLLERDDKIAFYRKLALVEEKAEGDK
jgi:hypothetical protein